MRKPSETSRSRLIAIFSLIDKLLDLGVFLDDQRGKGIVYDAVSLFAAPRSEALKSQSYYFFSLRLVFGSLRNKVSGTCIFIALIGENLLFRILKAGFMGVKCSKRMLG
jgi:hypothetical protein